MIRKSFNNNQNDLSKIPDGSGLYYFFENDRLLYVGKAKRLKWRIREHQKINEYTNQFINHLKTEIFPLLENNDIQRLLKQRKKIDFCIMMSSGQQRIDLAFHRVTKIEIEEMEHRLTKNAETERIQELRPSLNHEICGHDEEVDEIIDKCDKIGRILLKEFWQM